MLDNIRNLIRQGRQALDNNTIHVATTIDNKFHATKINASNLVKKPVAAALAEDVVENATPVHKQAKTPYDNYEHHAEELKPVAENLVLEERLEETQRVQQGRRSIEKYQMGNVLGEGAFSVVYSATDKISGEKVAIKVIKKYQLDQKQRDSVMKEVQLMAQLNHPNIVKLIDFVENDDYYYIIQEVVSGGELFNQIVKFTYFSEDLSRHVIVQVAEALLYMHEQVGIVHRDLKPENIFFKPIAVHKVDAKARQERLRRSDNPKTKVDEGEFMMNYGGGGIGLVKIGDFGLSKQISLRHKNALQTPCGTIGYTAPEIVRDQRYSKEVDMWALGCVLYILLCGFPPFFNDSIEELTRNVARGEFKFLSPWWDEISEGAKHCVSKLLTVNPGERYTVAEFLNDPWITDFLHRSDQFQQMQQQAAAKAAKTSTLSTTNISPTSEISVMQKRKGSGMPGFEVPSATKAKLSYSESLNNVRAIFNGNNDLDANIRVNVDLLQEEDDESVEEEDADEYKYSDFNSSSEFGVELHRTNHVEESPICALECNFEPGPAQPMYRDQDDDLRVTRNDIVNADGKRKMVQNTPQFTPEIKAMKGIFDMSIAAHRMYEEKEYNISNSVLEEAEEEDQFADEIMKDNTLNSMNGGFKLNIGEASILARRNNKMVAS